MMLNRGAANGRQILKAKTVAEMTRKQTGDLRARAGMPWGLGFCIIEDPSQVEANSTLSQRSRSAAIGSGRQAPKVVR